VDSTIITSEFRFSVHTTGSAQHRSTRSGRRGYRRGPDTVFRSARARDKIACYLDFGNRIEKYRSGTLMVNRPTPEAFTMRMFAEADRKDIAAITRGEHARARAGVELAPSVDQPELTANRQKLTRRCRLRACKALINPRRAAAALQGALTR
jgi:hypothetical protein